MTESGDISLSAEHNTAEFRLRFALADYSTQHIHFLCMPTSRRQSVPRKKGQHIQFRYVEHGEELKMQSGLVQEQKETLQSLYIALRTELGDVNDDSVGSDFYKVKHNIITENSDLVAIRDKAGEVVQRFFPGTTLEAEYVICPEGGNFQYQSIKFTIKGKDNGVIIASFVF